MDLSHGKFALETDLSWYVWYLVFAEFASVESTADNEDESHILGAMPNGTYECSYTAVYHLMTHDEHMLPEDLFQYTLVCLQFSAL